MNIIFDGEQLARLTGSLQTLCGVRVFLLGRDGRELRSGKSAPMLCPQVGEDREARARCLAFRAELAGSGGEIARMLRCPTGLCALAVPVRSELRAEPVALLCAGGFREAEDAPVRAEQFAPGGRSGDAPRALSRAEIDALSGMLAALADYIRLSGLILPGGESDLRRLERFLDEHYMEKLSLASVSAQLRIGRTRLCALAKQLSGGETLFALVSRKRIETAKELLRQTERPISAIAEAVGVSDYNYFSKIFRAAVGVSPSEFRKRSRAKLDKMV